MDSGLLLLLLCETGVESVVRTEIFKDFPYGPEHTFLST